MATSSVTNISHLKFVGDGFSYDSVSGVLTVTVTGGDFVNGVVNFAGASIATESTTSVSGSLQFTGAPQFRAVNLGGASSVTVGGMPMDDYIISLAGGAGGSSADSLSTDNIYIPTAAFDSIMGNFTLASGS